MTILPREHANSQALHEELPCKGIKRALSTCRVNTHQLNPSVLSMF